MSQRAGTILNAAGATVTGPAYQPNGDSRTFHARVTGTGAVGATVEIYGSDFDPSPNPTGVAGVLLGTITLSGNDDISDGFAAVTPWRYVWAKLTAISGTSAQCSVLMGVGK